MIKYGYLLKQQNMRTGGVCYLIVSNPVNSGRIMKIEKIIINSYLYSDIITSAPLYIMRSVGPDGMTPIPTYAYSRFMTFAPEPKGLVYGFGGGVASGDELFAIPAGEMQGKIGGSQGPQYEFCSENNPVILQEGECIAFLQTANADSDNYYNIMVGWDEILGDKKYG